MPYWYISLFHYVFLNFNEYRQYKMTIIVSMTVKYPQTVSCYYIHYNGSKEKCSYIAWIKGNDKPAYYSRINKLNICFHFSFIIFYYCFVSTYFGSWDRNPSFYPKSKKKNFQIIFCDLKRPVLFEYLILLVKLQSFQN